MKEPNLKIISNTCSKKNPFLKKRSRVFGGMSLFLLLVLSVLPLQSAQTIDATQYWMKIRAKNKFERSVIANLGVSMELFRSDFVVAIGSELDRQKIEKLGWLESSYAITSEMDFPERDSAFHNYSEMTASLQEIALKNPSITRLTSIGKSVEGRNIWAMRISSKLTTADQLPAVIFMGGHHAREHLSVELPLNYIQYLVDEYNKGNQRIRNLIDTRDIHIIPAVNPDGLEFDVSTGSYKYWRKNRARNSNGTYGVDLNRNYSVDWGMGGSSKDPQSDIYMGPTPFSEPETRAIRDYVDSNKNISILLSFHTFSELILYPWGGKDSGLENVQDKAVHETMAKKMAEWNHYTPEQASELYIATGDTCDWSYGTHRIISFTFELDPADQFGSGGFYPGAGVIPSVTQKNLEPFLYLVDHADNPYRVLQPDPISAF